MKRLVIALVALCALAGAGYVGVDYFNTVQRNARRAEERAQWDRQRQAAQADWQQMTPSERAYFKLSASLPDKGPMTERDEARLRAFRDFVPEVYQRLNGQEVGLKRQDIFDRVVAEDARAKWQAMTAKERREMKDAVRLGFIPDSPKERERMDALKNFVPEVYQPETEEERKTHPPRKGDIVSEEEALGKPTSTPDERWKSDPIVKPAPTP